jgi:hypothetical protein
MFSTIARADSVFTFTLPSTVTPTINPEWPTGGDEYLLTNVPITIPGPGIANGMIGLTPVADSEFGRFFLSYTFNGEFNGAVFWIDSTAPQPFTVSDGQITFIPGTYTHLVSDEALTVTATSTCCADNFSLNLSVSEPETFLLLGVGLLVVLVKKMI